MSQDNPTPRYKIQIKNIRGEIFDDTIHCICYKAPLIKKASYWTIRINVSTVWAEQVFYDIGKHNRISVELKISEVKYEGQKESYKIVKDIYERSCVCLNISNAKGQYKIDTTDMNTEVLLVLTDHILYDMSLKLFFNRRFTDTTAYDALQEFETKIVEQYGDNFYKNKVGVDKDKSSHIYEQILVAGINDLNVSDLLLYSKKALTKPSLYFFDDFYMDSKNDKAIAIHHINLFDINNDDFKKVNLVKYFDTSFQTIILKEVPLFDVFQSVTNGCSHWNVDNPRATDRLITDDTITVFKPIVTSTSEDDYEIDGERKAKIVKTEVKYEETKQKQKSTQIFTPDKSDLAIQRIKDFSEFIKVKAKQLVVIQTTDCYCDWLQFGRSYNIDVTSARINNYIATPILICNIFYKDGTERVMKHIAKSVMIEYYRPFENTCSSCSYFQSKTCILHKEPQIESNYCADHSANATST
jgi:hypothetical protein